MKNKDIKQFSYDEILKYERKRGRSPKIIEKEGYDILSDGGGETRHIEAKGSTKKEPPFRFLTQQEFKRVLNDKDYYLYLVS